MTTHLTDTQKQTIRIALAKHEGWVQRENWFERKWGDGERFGIEYIPNYPASLDACHAIEVKLTDEEHSAFRYCLREVIKWNERDFNCYRKLVSASAEHRSLALFRALNLGELGD